MKFCEAVSSFKNLDQFLSVEGKASRSEFWYVYLTLAIPAAVIGGLSLVIGYYSDYVQTHKACVAVACMLIGCLNLGFMPVFVRRLHDIGKPGWIAPVCIGMALFPMLRIVSGIAFVYFGCLPSVIDAPENTKEENVRCFWMLLIAIVIAGSAGLSMDFTDIINERIDCEIRSITHGY